MNGICRHDRVRLPVELARAGWLSRSLRALDSERRDVSPPCGVALLGWRTSLGHGGLTGLLI